MQRFDLAHETDGRTDERIAALLGPIGGGHNKLTWKFQLHGGIISDVERRRKIGIIGMETIWVVARKIELQWLHTEWARWHRIQKWQKRSWKIIQKVPERYADREPPTHMGTRREPSLSGSNREMT